MTHTCNDLVKSAIANKSELHPSSEHYVISVMFNDALRLGCALGNWIKSGREWEHRPADAAIEAAGRTWARMTCKMLADIHKREAAAEADAKAAAEAAAAAADSTPLH